LAKADASLAEVETEQKRDFDHLALNLAETSAKRGEIALTRLRYNEAAKHFANAAAVFTPGGAYEDKRISYLQSEAARSRALASARAAAEKALGPCPFERHLFAGLFLQRLTIGGDGLFELRRPALTLAQPPKRKTEIDLGSRPGERIALAGCSREDAPNGGEGLFKACCAGRRRPSLRSAG
jgi:hypothetical protein